MTDDNLNDTQQSHYCSMCDNLVKLPYDCRVPFVAMNSVGISKAQHDESQRSVLEREIWNAAIEAAALIMDNETDRANVRSLKK